MLTMRPNRRSTIAPMAACDKKNAANRLTARWRCQSSGRDIAVALLDDRAGVIDQVVDPAVRLQHLADKAPAGILVAHVGPVHGDGRAPVPAASGKLLSCAAIVDERGGDVDPGRRQPLVTARPIPRVPPVTNAKRLPPPTIVSPPGCRGARTAAPAAARCSSVSKHAYSARRESSTRLPIRSMCALSNRRI